MSYNTYIQNVLHPRWLLTIVAQIAALRSSCTMRTKCAISDAFVRDCVFAYCASVAQHVYSLSAEYCFRLRNNAISDERVRDCALSTHSVFRPLGLRCVTTNPNKPTNVIHKNRSSTHFAARSTRTDCVPYDLLAKVQSYGKRIRWLHSRTRNSKNKPKTYMARKPSFLR